MAGNPPARPAGASSRPDLTANLRALEERGVDELRVEWRRLHRAEPPTCFSRDLLLRSIAHQLQEAAFGGLPAWAHYAGLVQRTAAADDKPLDFLAEPSMHAGTGMLA